MQSWTARRLTALVLGLVFALAITLPTVQAAEMAVKMSADAAKWTAAGPDRCNACGGDDDIVNAAPCVMICPGSLQAVGPVASLAVLAEGREAGPVRELALAGRISSPDPYPPKPEILI